MNGTLAAHSVWSIDRIKDYVSKIGSGVTPSWEDVLSWTGSFGELEIFWCGKIRYNKRKKETI
jgi:hypothetical protein